MHFIVTLMGVVSFLARPPYYVLSHTHEVTVALAIAVSNFCIFNRRS